MEAMSIVAGHYRTLWSVAGRYGSVVDRYRAHTKRYGSVTKNVDFAHH